VNAMLLPVSVADIYNIFLDQNFNKWYRWEQSVFASASIISIECPL
jgi:hypothetical protein